MKRLGKIAACLAGGLLLNAGLRAATANRAPTPASAPAPAPVPVINSSPDNPYAAIATRNIFGLNPPVVETVDTNALLEASLPKITPTGIMGIFSNLSVLFKVGGAAAVKPGQPAKDEFYILSEGQRQDDIEVIKIDEKKSLVTFNNHGTTQELPLANGPASGGAPAAAPSPITGNPGVRGLPGGGVNNGGFTRFGAGSGGSNGGTPNNNPGSNGGGPSLGSSMNSDDPATDPHIYHPPAPTISAADSEATIVLNHLTAQLHGDPTAPFYPPTPHDAEAGITPNP